MQRDFIGEDKSKTALTDEELVVCCRSDEKYIYSLIARYVPLVKSRASCFSGGASSDIDDLMQEGFLGLIGAIRSYNPEKESSFATYANVCVTNKMRSALSKTKTNDIPAEEDGDGEPDINTPETIFFEKESNTEIEKVMSTHLSEKERTIFRLFLQGSTYEQIAVKLDTNTKTVDNALQRVRKKLKSVWTYRKFMQ